MRLSEALSPATDIDIQFKGGGVLRVKYRPSHATIAELQAVMTGTADEQVTAVINQIIDVIVDWDLFQDDGETKVPLEFEALRHVPSNIFMEILSGVKEHQSAGKAPSSSLAG